MNPKILIVEDDVSTATQIREMLASLEYAISAVVSSGEDAIRESAKTDPSLVLMDIKLKGKLDGIEAARQIHGRLNIPIVFLTSIADEATLQRAKVSDPFGYILKPIEKRKLRTAVEVALYRHKMEEKLKKNQQLLRATLKCIGDAVIATDADGRIMFINNGAEELTGWTWAEALGESLPTVFNIIREKNRSPIENLVEGVLKKGFIFEPIEKIILISRNGKEIPVENNAAPIREDDGKITGVVIICRDISKREEAHQDSVKSNQLLGNILAGISEGFIAMNNDLVVNIFNEAAEKLLNRNSEEVINRYMFDAFPEAKGSVFEKNYRLAVRRRKPISFETYFGKKPYKNWYDVHVYPFEGGISVFFQITTERKQAEEALRESEKKYRVLFQSTAEGILAADMETKKFKFANPAFCKMLGYTEEEVIKLGVMDIHPQESLPLVFAAFDAQARGEKSLASNIPCLRKDGKIIYADVNSTRTIIDGRQYNVGFFSDVTERKDVARVLLESEAEWRSLVENAPDMIMTIDNEYKILFLNHALPGSTVSDAIGESIFKYMSTEDKEIMWGALEKVFGAGESVSFEIQANFPTGITAWLATRLGPIKRDDKIIAAALFATDVTNQKQSEKQRIDLREQLTKAEKMESLGLLAGGVAHDLNNIIMPLVAYPDLILRNIPKGNPAVKQIKRLGKSAEGAAAVIQDLLTMARRGRYTMQPTNLNDVIESYLDSPGFIKLREENRKIKFRKKLDKNAPDILGSATHLSKVVMNLIVNAYDAMPEGGELTVSTNKLYLKKLADGYGKIKKGDHIAFTVKDTGIGIDKKDIEKIFEPYYSNKEIGRSGSGLGLSVVYGILKDHNGYYDIVSAPGEGTSFIFYFPILKSPVDVVEDSDTSNKSAIENLKGDESVLVVDDFDEHRDLTSELLASLGYRVEQVENGREAVEYIKNHKVDIIVLDMIMEESFDALDTFREIAKIKPSQKAVVISGYSPNERVEKLQNLGVGQFVKKPFSRGTLAKAVRTELDTKQMENVT